MSESGGEESLLRGAASAQPRVADVNRLQFSMSLFGLFGPRVVRGSSFGERPAVGRLGLSSPPS
jgi:hypothetical protein